MALNNLKRFFITLCMGVFIFSLYGCDDGGGGGGGDNDGPIVNDPTINLRILEMETPSTADAGEVISIDYTLYMDWIVYADAYYDSFTVQFYLSGDASIDSSDTFIGEEIFSNVDMNELENQPDTADITLPAVAAGTYYIGIIVDSSNAIVEFNEDDNTISDSMEVTEPAELQPNLYFVSLSCPSNVTVGDDITFSCNIGNNGEADAEGVVANYYISTDQTISAADIYLGTVLVGPVAHGNSSGVVSGLFTVSADMPAGTYYFGSIVDHMNSISESDETDNVSTGGVVQQIIIDRDLPNLRPRALVTPASVLDNGSITITLQVENVGSSGSGEIDVDVYLSSDNTITASDTLLTSTGTSSGLLNGQYVEITVNNVVVDAGFTNSRYYIGYIVDCYSAILESNETDNITTSANGVVNLIHVLEPNTAVLEIVNDYQNGVGSLLRRPGTSTSWVGSDVYNYATSYSLGTWYFYITAGTYDFWMWDDNPYGWGLFDEVFSVGGVYTWTLSSANRETNE